MRVLPVGYINYQSKTNNCKPRTEQSFQKNLITVPEKYNFDNSDAITVASAIGVISGGAALALSAPIAMVIGAFILAAPVALVTGAAAVKSIAEAKKPTIANLFKLKLIS